MPDKKSRIGYRPTWAEINLKNLDYNFRQIKKLIASKPKVMVTVKADAYGHGLIPVAKRLKSLGVDYLGVASIDEGIRLREAGIQVPVLVLGAVLKKDIAPLFKYKLNLALCTPDLAAALNNRAAALAQKINVHIKVDTGMGRFGVLHGDALAFLKKIQPLKFIHIEGIFTHFPLADTDRSFTLRQIELFGDLVLRLKENGIEIPLVHAANSMGVIGYQNSHFNLVRPGLMVYGLYPAENLKVRLKPVLSLRSRVIYAKRVPGGYGISYGHIYISKRATTIATLPIGYGDGYPRNLSNKAPVLINGRRLKISGRICMDQMTVDVGDLKVKTGDEVVLIGRQGKNSIGAQDLAKLCGTISYEIVCGLGSRIPRIYK